MQEKPTIFIILLNVFLLVIKAIAALLSNSVALFSDALNSLMDIVASVGVFYSVKVSEKQADKDHPFGHARAQPIAALIIAIFTAMLGIELIRFAIERIFGKPYEIAAGTALIALVITIAVKAGMFFYLKKFSKKNPALNAVRVDARNDVLISAMAFIGVILAASGIILLDALCGAIIGVYIIFSAYSLGKENINYLTGKSASKELIEEIRKKALSVEKVNGLNTVRAHYAGNFHHVEVHIELDNSLTLTEAHNIGKKVELAIEGIEGISECFVHIDPR